MEPPTTDLQRRLGLDRAQYLALEKLARDNDRSVAAELRRAVRFYLRAHGEQASPDAVGAGL